MTQLVTMASYNIAFAPYVSDFSRYLPKFTPTPKVIAAVLGGACASGFVMVALGAWLASALGETDALVGIYDAGNRISSHFGIILAIVSVIALNAAMGMNAYSAHLTLLIGIASFRTVTPNRANHIRAILALAIVWYTIAISLGGDYLTSLTTL